MNVLSAVSDEDGRVKKGSGKFQYFFMLFRFSFFLIMVKNNNNKKTTTTN